MWLNTIKLVDSRSDWALCSCRFAFAQRRASWGRPMSRLGQQDVGHEGVITGRDALSLRSPIAYPQGVAQSSLQSTYIHSIRFNKCYPQLLVTSQLYFFR